MIAWLVCLVVSAQADQSEKEVEFALRTRQAIAETVHCQVEAITHYARESQFVPGQLEREPPLGRSQSRTIELNLSGPAKFCIQQKGGVWHRRMGRIVDADIVRVCDGNLFAIIEQPYKSIPTWRPKPRYYSKPNVTSQEHGWEDLVLTPILFHFRPFNSRQCPFVTRTYEITDTPEIDGTPCVLFSPRGEADYTINQFRYFLAPSKSWAALRIERLTNDRVHWQYEIEYEKQDASWLPKRYMIRRLGEERLLEFTKVTVQKLQINQPIDDSRFTVKTPVSR